MDGLGFTTPVGRALARLPRWIGPAAVGLMTIGFGRGCLCANAEYSRAYDAHVRSQTDRYRHAATESEVRAAISEASAGWGYRLDPTDDRSAWETADETRERLDVELSEDGGIAVRLFTRREALSAPQYEPSSRKRSRALERELFERLYPGKEATDGEIAAHAYALAPDVVWNQLVQVLAARGYMMDAMQPIDGEQSVSQWKIAEDGSGRHRYEVALELVADEHMRVEIFKHAQRAVGTRRWLPESRDRRHDLELELIARRDPQRGAEIERVAEREGQEAYDAALERGGMACGR